MNILEDIEGFLAGILPAIKEFFAKAEAEEDKILPAIVAAVTKFEALIANPTAVVLESLVPDGIGTELAAIIKAVGADILAGITYLEGLNTAPATPGAAPSLVNPDAVVQAAVTKISAASTVQQQSSANEYGAQLLLAASPKDGNIGYAQANLAKALYTKATA